MNTKIQKYIKYFCWLMQEPYPLLEYKIQLRYNQTITD